MDLPLASQVGLSSQLPLVVTRTGLSGWRRSRTQTSKLLWLSASAPRSETKAMRLPSLDQAGSKLSESGALVRLIAAPPRSDILKISRLPVLGLIEVNTTPSALGLTRG